MKIKSFFLSLIVMFLFIAPVLAIDIGGKMVDTAATQAGYGPVTETTLSETLGTVVKAALAMVGVIFLLLMVYAGYLWMTARGEEETIKKSQKIIVGSIIGLVIVVASYSITNFVVLAILSKTTSTALTK
ncbi:MAG: hypothetical protein ABIJ23_02950 [Candidatus Magasanikbacteria bacterium]